MNWLTLSIIALVLLSVMAFLITVLTRKGYPVSFVLFGLGITFTIVFFIQTFAISRPSFVIHTSTIIAIFIIGILSTVGNLAFFQAVNDAPNAGLAVAVGGGLQAAVVSVLAFVFFKDKLTLLQIIGILFAIFAVFFINLGSAHQVKKQNAPQMKKVNLQK